MPSHPSPRPALLLNLLFNLFMSRSSVLTLPESSFWNSGQAVLLCLISSIIMYSTAKERKLTLSLLYWFFPNHLTKITYQRLFPKGKDCFSSPPSGRENWASFEMNNAPISSELVKSRICYPHHALLPFKVPLLCQWGRKESITTELFHFTSASWVCSLHGNFTSELPEKLWKIYPFIEPL